MTIPEFSTRAARLEDARAASQEACERQLVTAQAAAEFRLTDFLAAGFAEAHRRYLAASPEERYDAKLIALAQSPEEYGADVASYFLDILKEVSAVRAPAPEPETIELLPASTIGPAFREFVGLLLQDFYHGTSL